ncbi:hypothetical protein LTR84_002295 [Exophiala bonariae]|uniref:Nucleoprotein TPR/MLP1 domain-containing protein n=1 Tax=Exophiala bonariae TaxID=1690606 RepID=A0AAV9NB15_9EURO|nr:hypothetical protein LTR84_002295 [Exophiala bonariae]
MAAPALDVRVISTFTAVPEASITSLLNSPTTELVQALLHGIETRAKEYEQNKSQKVKLEVELETVVRTNESKTKVLQNSRDKALAESSKLRVELQTSENARSRLETDLEQYRSATVNETSETNTLKARISSLESANRDTLALLESKTTSFENLSQELSAQHQKGVELRKQITALEQSTQAANSTVASAKFKEQSLQQEVEMLKKNNEWLENERKIKADEHTAFRKEKNARISELSRSNEQYISEIETLRRSETSLKNRLEDQATKYEDLLEEKQKLQEEHISSEDAFRREVETTKRLADLQQATAETAKERVKELLVALDEARADAADEIGAIRAESETEHADKVAAEERVAELESALEQLRTELEDSRARPSTPQRPTNGVGFSTPLRPGTPSGVFSPHSISRPKAQMTMTQLFSEYKKLESELASEKRASEQLRSNLDSMVEELENNKPEIEELRMDHDRLQTEIIEMSTIVDQANSARESSAKELRAVQGNLESRSKEVQVLAQQLRDLGTQIRFLLIEQHIKEHGGSMTREDFDQLEAQANQAMTEDMANLSETQQVINQRLIVFKNITELQRQNEDQLKTIRNLVIELESNEAKEKELQNHALQQELEEARQNIATYKDELKSQMAQSKSFAKERDMLRNMLVRRGHLPGGVQPTDFSKSLPIPAAESPAASVTGESDYAKLLKDVQHHFDSFRQESSADRTTLKTQVDELSRKNSQLQTEISRTVGQLTAANQRYEMLQANYNSLKTENGEIQKRSWSAMENATKQELKTQQVAEELVEARGLLDSLRRDSANLKAEKDLWKSVERRLIEDNESLRTERGRLDSLNASLQTMINEREQTEAESRRRLQSQTEALETELQSVKRQLNQELEESKKLSLRREYEHDQSQKRIDDLVTSLGSTKEELASAKTSRDHLQARVDEMTVELRSAEERLEVFTRPAEPSVDVNATDEASLTKQQELEVEISELKRDLELKISELERANEQVEVYKSISQSSEERLQELGDTNEQYREETEAALAEKDAKIKDLEQRAEDISSELSTTNSELSRLRDEQAEAGRKLDEQKSIFEADIERLKEEAVKSAEQAQFNLEASKIQAQIATEAQQNYENELVKHAEAAKTVQIVREEANQLKLQMVDLKTQAETAKANLEQKSSSWDEMKDRFEREAADLKKRREEVAKQNNLLHNQLESVTQQISALQRDRAALAEGQDSEPSGPSTAELDKLQEVITYLRREKDIVDMQYQLSTQEAKRLRQQLDFTQSQLDETRLKLDQQRRIEADAERNALSHNQLMDTLNELNLFRESSVTLRAEAKRSAQVLAEKSTRVEELEGQLQTLNARVAELENLVELREGELKLSQEDRDHWQQRTQNILSKYDRVDPADLEALKENISTLETERDEARNELSTAATELDQAKAELQTQIDGQQAAIKESNADLRSRLSTQFKEVVQKNKAALNEVKAQLDAAVAEKDSLQTELDSTKEQLESSQAQAAAVPQAQVNGDHGNAPNEALNERIAELEAKVTELETALAAKEKELDEFQSTQEEKFKSRVAAMEKVLNGRLKEVKQDAQASKAAALEELATRLNAEHEQELQAARTQANATAPESATPTDKANQASAPESQQPADDITQPESPAIKIESLPNEVLSAGVTKPQLLYLAKSNPMMKELVSNTIAKRVDLEKQALQKKFEEERAMAKENGQVSEQPNDLEEKLQAQIEAIIQEEEAKFSQEKENLVKQHQDVLAREKQSLVIKHQEELSSQQLQFDEDSQKKIAEQIKNAEQLWEKRGAVKLNMAQRSAQLANAKIEVVKKAAEETPTKPVSEVWEIAKDAKPAPAQPKPATPLPTAPAVPSSAPAPAAVATPAVQQPPVQAESKTETAVAPQPQPSSVDGVGEPKATAAAAQDKPLQQIHPVESMKPQQTQAPNALQQLQSGIPRGGASRGRAGSGIPRGRGGAPRGGRGGNQGGNAQQANRGGHAPGSPNRGGLNPQAAQFNPGGGNKRARDDGASEDASQGKRLRGEAGST